MLKLFTKGLIEDKVFEVTQTSGDYVYACTTFKCDDVEIVANISIKTSMWEKCVERFLFSDYYKKQ